MALKSLLQNRLQALLTLSGMSIGVAMVVLVSGLGLGAQQQIENQIESAGPTLITIKPGNFRPPSLTTAGQQDNSGGELSEGSMSEEDLYGNAQAIEQNAALMDARQRITAVKQSKSRTPAWPLSQLEKQYILEEMDNIRAIAGNISGNVTMDNNPGIRIRTANVFGFESGWEEMLGWNLVSGRFISPQQHASAAPVMLVTTTVADRLWPGEEALNKQLNIGGKSLQVIGVIQDNEATGGSIIVPRVNLPLSLARQMLKRNDYDEIRVRSNSVAFTSALVTELREGLRELRELPEDTVNDFRVESQGTASMPGMGMDPSIARAVQSNIVEFEQEAWEEMALSLRQAGRTFTLLLSAAAAVSLIVGGIGVMNIMLVSVAARTREIGLRMALGARMKDVLVQFMVEAVTLAALGGLIGLVLGTAGLYVAANGLQWATAISPGLFLFSILMAAATGVIFGFGPARRAAGLDPVVALKME